ncbi:hypothetical protein IJ579_06740 [bacterium]|nr:hypothetical protein [bacterium]
MQNQIQNGISSSAVTPQLNYIDVIQQLEGILGNDVKRLQMLMQQGVINQNQWQYLMTELTQKLHALQTCKQAIPQAPLPQIPQQVPEAQQPETQNPFDLFNKEKPGFFDKAGRADVLNYLQTLDVDKDEISKIAGLVEGLESSAIDGYLKQSAHEKSLNDENSAAKSKLTSYAQNASQSGNNNRIFTREDIGNMSGEEFAKNEKLIMEQVKQGLIK